jgi:Tat protein translocase TatB subunit
MFEVGFTEIVLILGIALLVLGPQRLPKLAADLGRWAGKARGMARQLKTQLEQEASTFDPLRNTSTTSSTIHTPPPAPATTAPMAAEPAHPSEPAVAATPPLADPPTDAPEASDESKRE